MGGWVGECVGVGGCVGGWVCVLGVIEEPYTINLYNLSQC